MPEAQAIPEQQLQAIISSVTKAKNIAAKGIYCAANCVLVARPSKPGRISTGADAS